MSGVKFIDSTGVGLLIQWKKLAQNRGFQVALIAPSSAVQRALSLLRLQKFFLTATDTVNARQVIATHIRHQAVRMLPSSANNTICIQWQGEITARNTLQVWKATHSIVEKMTSSKRWMIDLSEVPFLDSSGIGLMIRLKKWARQSDADLFFTNLQPASLNVLRLAHLEEFLLAPPAHSTN